MNENLCWTALQVRPRSEKLVAATLSFKGIESFLPVYKVRRRWSDRIKEMDMRLFAGYVFCRSDLRHRMPILTIPTVMQFFGSAKQPLPIEEAEITAIQSVVRSGLPSVPWPYLKVGQRVRIEHGPLRDTEGILLEVKGAERLIVSVTLLQRSVAVELDRDW